MKRVFGPLLRLGSGTQAKILVTFAIGQALVLLTGLARIPIIVHAIGAVGYGLLLSITSIAPWLLLAVGGLTNVARVDVAEALGAGDTHRALAVLDSLLHRARRMALALIVISVLVMVVPWSGILGSDEHMPLAAYELPVSVAVSGLLVASSTPGAVHQGLLQADRRVVITSILPGVAATLSLLITAVAAAVSAPFLAFVVATGVASSAPYWIAHILGRQQQARLRGKVTEQPDGTTAGHRPGTVGDLVVMTGAAAPPLFSTGWDPLTLGAAAGPADVAAYGLASRLALLVSVGPSALYPHYWSEYARLRAGGDLGALARRLRRDVVVVTALTATLGAVFVAIGPIVGRYIGSGAIAQPVALYVAMAVLGVLTAVQTVLLPVLGDRESARIVAGLVFGFMLPNVALSYLLSRTMGAYGPVVASIIFCSLLLIVAAVLIKRRLTGAGPATNDDGPDGDRRAGVRRQLRR